MRHKQETTSPNGHDGVRQIMSRVMFALIPGTLVSAIYLGSGVVMNLLFAILLAVLLESVVALLRRRSIKVILGDGSVVLAAWLLALCLPPLLPFWQIAIGIAAMVLLGKHLYGGLGNNPFNPAMVGYAVLIVSFPLTMSLWSDPKAQQDVNFSETLAIKVQTAGAASEQTPSRWDAISRATPLTQWRTDSLQSVSQDANLVQIQSQLFSTAWPLISLCWLFGGLYLLYSRIISWHIPACFLVSLGTLHGLHSVFSNSVQMSVPVALLSGGAMLGAFFIATDPVSAPASKLGRCLFATGIGTLTFSLREFSAYPEGIAFAVLLMNCIAPVIDHFSGNGTRQNFRKSPVTGINGKTGTNTNTNSNSNSNTNTNTNSNTNTNTNTGADTDTSTEARTKIRASAE